jgi:hypothetical protein
MPSAIQVPPARADLVESMRDLAQRGGSVRELVCCIRSEMGLEHDALLQVLWYFMKAFHLPLGQVLPIREWLGTGNDEEIDALILPAIRRSREKWSG